MKHIYRKPWFVGAIMLVVLQSMPALAQKAPSTRNLPISTGTHYHSFPRVGQGAFLGVEYERTDDGEGVRIIEVVEGSAADIMGLKEGDVLLSINKEPIDGGELGLLISKHAPGEVVEVAIKRRRRTKTITGVLGRRSSENSISHHFERYEDLTEIATIGKPKLGVHIEKQEVGVAVTKVIEGSAAEKMGLQAGDIIESINKTKVATVEELIAEIQEVEGGEEVEVVYERLGKRGTTHGTLTHLPTEFFFKGDFKSELDSFLMPEIQGFKEDYKIWLNEGFPSDIKVIILRGTSQDPQNQIILESLSNTSDEVRVLESDLSLQAFQLYPNPSEGQVTVSFETSGVQEVSIKVTSIDNREVYVGTYAGLNNSFSQTLDLASNPPGIYILQISSGGKSYFERIVLK